MTSLGQHADFIVAAYAIAIIIVVGLIAWVWTDYQTQRRVLGELDKRGVKRRSRKPARK